MLDGYDWCLAHIFATEGKRGNTLAGRQWTARVRKEGGLVKHICDECGFVEEGITVEKMRLLVSKARRQEVRWGRHKCNKCAMKFARKKQHETWNDPELRRKHARTITAAMSKISGKERIRWRNNCKKGIQLAFDNMSPEERSRGVRKQWETMSDEVKAERAEKIGRWAREFWSSMTDEERCAHVEKMIKGLPRSKASDDFKQALIEAQLYDGFQSEVAISGFVVDEANITSKIAIEFFGDYYHCNPRIYDEMWYNNTLNVHAHEKWRYDRRRLAAIRKAGFKVIVVWESDWNTNPSDVLRRLKREIYEKRESD